MPYAAIVLQLRHPTSLPGRCCCRTAERAKLPFTLAVALCPKKRRGGPNSTLAVPSLRDGALQAYPPLDRNWRALLSFVAFLIPISYLTS